MRITVLWLFWSSKNEIAWVNVYTTGAYEYLTDRFHLIIVTISIGILNILSITNYNQLRISCILFSCCCSFVRSFHYKSLDVYDRFSKLNHSKKWNAICCVYVLLDTDSSIALYSIRVYLMKWFFFSSKILSDVGIEILIMRSRNLF